MAADATRNREEMREGHKFGDLCSKPKVPYARKDKGNTETMQGGG